jgi:hypothetical protein
MAGVPVILIMAGVPDYTYNEGPIIYN